MTHENGVHHAVCVILKVVLLEHRQAFAWAHLHSSFVWLQVSTDGAQEGGFTRTIGADDAVDVATGKFDVYVFVKYTFAKLYG